MRNTAGGSNGRVIWTVVYTMIRTTRLELGVNTIGADTLAVASACVTEYTNLYYETGLTHWPYCDLASQPRYEGAIQ